MFIAWSDADADWVEEIEIVSSFECKYVLNPLGLCFFFHREGNVHSGGGKETKLHE